MEINKDDLALLLSLVPDWVKTVPPNLDPTFYGTGTYNGDKKIKAQIDKIRKSYEMD